MRWTATLMMSPSVLLKAASQLSIAWGSPWLSSLSLMYVSLWTELTNTREWKKTSCKGKERRRLSLKRWGISSRIYTTITVRREISQGNTDQPTCRWLTPYSENRYSRFWRKSRMNHSSSGRIRWLETPWSAIRVCIVSSTRIMGILQKTAGTFGTTWISWSEKENWDIFCIIPVVTKARQTMSPKKTLP